MAIGLEIHNRSVSDFMRGLGCRMHHLSSLMLRVNEGGAQMGVMFTIGI